MLVAIKGIYENGHVILDELPPVNKRMAVIVTFTDEILPPKRPLGTMKGTIKMSDDFTDPIDDLKDYM